MEGDTPTAVELFRLSLKPPEENNAGWNEYVRANIAFLEGDFERLLNEREALSAMARPGYGDINLGVVNGLIACFGRTYLDAYTTAECDRRPMQ
ncbi:putative lipoprotein [Hyphomonas hirschiana VP5]|nr:putative lipoprotein [Hyphomonas hirschiana VP5]